MFAGHRDRLVREHNELAWGVWHVPALMRSQKMPRLNEMIASPKAVRSAYQTPEERWASFAGASLKRMQ